jgi:hypothetical protein
MLQHLFTSESAVAQRIGVEEQERENVQYQRAHPG